MAGKPKLRLTDKQRQEAEENAGLAWLMQRKMRLMAPWLSDDDVLSLCGEALCRAVHAWDRKGRKYKLGTYLDWQTRSLAGNARSYHYAQCRQGKTVRLPRGL